MQSEVGVVKPAMPEEIVVFLGGTGGQEAYLEEWELVEAVLRTLSGEGGWACFAPDDDRFYAQVMRRDDGYYVECALPKGNGMLNRCYEGQDGRLPREQAAAIIVEFCRTAAYPEGWTDEKAFYG